MTKRVAEALGVIGGLLGLVYAVGFLVLAGHYRVLGLPIRSTDPVLLLGTASEFLVRGSLVIVLRSLESVLPGRFGFLVLLAVIGIGAVTVITAFVRQGWRPSEIAPKIVAAWFRVPNTENARLVVVVAVIGITAGQAWHFAANVIPTGAVTSLLLNRSDASPFLGVTRTFFESRWNDVQEDLLGNGKYGYTRNLSRRYVMHLIVSSVTFLLAAGLWMFTRRAHGHAVKMLAAVPLVAGAFLLTVVTPLYYGALVKSYRYPLVHVIGSSGLKEHDDLRTEFRQGLLSSRFLLEATKDDLYLFDDRAGAILVLKRAEVALVKIVAEDFLFRSHQ